MEFDKIKCGFRLVPPALVTVFLKGDTTLKARIMPVRNFKITSNAGLVAEKMKYEHMQTLARVPTLTIEKMLRVIQEVMKGVELHKALESVKAEFTIGSSEDLNKLGEEEVQRKKKIMDETFNENRVKPGDAGFIYDKRVDFESNTAEKRESEWDNEEKDDFWN